jgi:Resolvase, N terminal domain
VISLCRCGDLPTRQAAASSREVHDDEASTHVVVGRRWRSGSSTVGRPPPAPPIRAITGSALIDEDLGKSGATAAGRTGFQRLVAEVSLGHAGAVLGLEVSRLARNNRDWYRLLDLCGLMNTLIVDAEGVYDPRQLNDRLLLGLKGTISEAELGWIRQRAHEGLLAKARRGP